MAELSQEVAQEEQTQQSTQVVTDPEAGMTTEEKLLKRSDEIKQVLDVLSKEQVDPSVYIEALEDFTDEKKAEIEQISNTKKTITRKTCFGYGIDLLVWQEVWTTNGEITKYGSFYTRGLMPSGVLGVGGGNQINSRLPFPDTIEFDAIFYCEGTFLVRPKQGQGYDDYLFCFGNGSQGNLGNGKTGNVYATYYEKIQMSARVKKIVFATEIGTKVSCIALLENGEVWGTGKNYYGELGLGNTAQVNSWTRITNGADDIYSGSPSLFIVKGSNLYVAGAGEMGSLGQGSTSSINGITQVKSSVDVKLIKSMRYYNGSGFYASTLMLSGEKILGAGYNGNNQIISADTSNKNTFTEITDSFGSPITCLDGTDFAIGLQTNIILTPNTDGNTDLWVAGMGEDGYGDSQSAGTNNKRRKIKTLDGLGWKCECPVLGYGEGTMRSSFFIFNEERKEVLAFGFNGAGGISVLGIGVASETVRGLSSVTLPKSEYQFEVSFNIGKAGGFYPIVIADGTLYITGGSKSGILAGTYTQLNPVVSVM